MERFRSRRTKLVKVCDLTDGFSLWANRRGWPYIKNPYGESLKMDRPYRDKEWVAIVESWQKRSDNDCLRAQGNARWTAACVAASLFKPKRTQAGAMLEA